jgi:hypothetical protein
LAAESGPAELFVEELLTCYLFVNLRVEWLKYGSAAGLVEEGAGTLGFGLRRIRYVVMHVDIGLMLRIAQISV